MTADCGGTLEPAVGFSPDTVSAGNVSEQALSIFPTCRPAADRVALANLSESPSTFGTVTGTVVDVVVVDVVVVDVVVVDVVGVDVVGVDVVGVDVVGVDVVDVVVVDGCEPPVVDIRPTVVATPSTMVLAPISAPFADRDRIRFRGRSRYVLIGKSSAEIVRSKSADVLPLGSVTSSEKSNGPASTERSKLHC